VSAPVHDIYFRIRIVILQWQMDSQQMMHSTLQRSTHLLPSLLGELSAYVRSLHQGNTAQCPRLLEVL
jgi:hypothetical protein